MRLKTRTWCLISLLLFAAAIGFWLYGNAYERQRRAPGSSPAESGTTPGLRSARPPVSPFQLQSTSASLTASTRIASIPAAFGEAPPPADKNYPHLLRNTARLVDDLARSDTAILLRNAFIETANPKAVAVPEALRAAADTRTFIVQARGLIGHGFRARIDGIGARIVSYIPNNAYLVRGDTEALRALAGAPEVHAVLAYEPYYKLDPHLLKLAVEGEPLPAGRWLRVTVFNEAEDAARVELAGLGAEVITRQETPFGPQLIVRPSPDSLVSIARVDAVQTVERFFERVLSTDLTRPRMGVAEDGMVSSNYLGLTGREVLVNVNDSGVDARHPDLRERVFSPDPGQLRDTAGHGTLIAGIIAGDGSQSGTVSEMPQGSLTNANFRGMAPGARILATRFSYDNPEPNDWLEDAFITEQGARTNLALRGSAAAPLISNNSWSYDGANDYDSSAALWDAAVRDALRDVPGSQGAIYVFAAGNSGNGRDDGTSPNPNTIASPANAKNVITVGAVENLRNITNETVRMNPDGTTTTNTPFLGITDDEFQVASFSSRGNVSLGVESSFGRFKPDLVAPGTFIVGPRSELWDPERVYRPDDPLGQIMKDLVAPLAPAYRIDSGTSFSAPVVSGMLALMQELFEQRLPQGLRRTNSPALMKALLINSARSLGGIYDLNVRSVVNHQGWGLPSLTNALPSIMLSSPTNDWPIRLIDQSPANALATGESRSWRVSLTNTFGTGVRITLVWTDPPGNPAAGLKLVNDLDLIVSNEVSQAVYYGNNIPAFSDYTLPSTPGDIDQAPRDFVNNVENVFIGEEVSDLVITVQARRVNVNAVPEGFLATRRTNDVLQDFALVVALEDTSLTNSLTMTATNFTLPFTSGPQTITNGVPLLNQRAGAIPTLLPAQAASNQWQFYVFTNIYITNSLSSLTNGTNVAFIIFDAPNLARPRVTEADLDLYVSSDRRLLDLHPAALAAADRSVGRKGSEFVAYTNAAIGSIFYIAVKSEDQQAGEYGFVGISSDLPFDELVDGSRVLRGFPVNVAIPDGNPNDPGAVQIFAIGLSQTLAQRVAVTNVLTHEQTGDLVGFLEHNGTTIVLNNHNPNNGFSSVTNAVFIYDDTLVNQFYPGVAAFSRQSDGPGSLRDFAGEPVNGVWIFTMVDDAEGRTGRVESVVIQVDPLVFGDDLASQGIVDFQLGPFQEASGVQEVPPGVTNMILRLSNLTGPIEAYFRRDALPTTNEFDKMAVINPPGGDLAYGITDSPPLTAGRYFFTVRNPNNTFLSGAVQLILERDPSLEFRRTLFTTNQLAIVDGATVSSSLLVALEKQVYSVDVGVRIKHPRPSDLVLHLTSPQGTRLLLAENRGGALAGGYGSGELTNQLAYTIFTESTNFARAVLDPIKFTLGPFTNVYSNTNGPVLTEEFELWPLGAQSAPALVQGWTIQRGAVFVHDDFSFADAVGNAGLQFIEFVRTTNEPASFRRSLPTVPGNLYTVSGAYRQNPADTAAIQSFEVFFGRASSNRLADRFIQVTRTNWQNFEFTFEAQATNAVLEFVSSSTIGPLLDSIVVTESEIAGASFVLPEESLREFRGERALGNWTLEITDTRPGPAQATPGVLVSWMLRLQYADAFPPAPTLLNGMSFSGTLTNAQTNYFVVDLCPDTRVASIIVNGPADGLRLQVDRRGFPTGNFETDEFVPVLNSLQGFGVFTLNTRDYFPAPLPVGGRLFVAVFNERPFEENIYTNDYTLRVSLDSSLCQGPRGVIRLQDDVPYPNVIAPGAGLVDYYVYRVSPLAEKVEFELIPQGGDLGLMAKHDLPLPNLTNSVVVDATGTGPETLVIDGSGVPVPLVPGDWYLGVYNNGSTIVPYTIRAKVTINPNLTVIPLTNAVPLDITFDDGLTPTNYFLFHATNDFESILFEVDNLNQDATLLIGLDRLPPYTNSLQFTGSRNAPISALMTAPVLGSTNLLGEWYLAVIGSQPGPLSFTITATGRTGAGTNTVKVPVEITFTNGLVCLSWNSVIGARYLVQAVTNVLDLAATAPREIIEGPFAATDVRTTRCYDPASFRPPPLRFFEVLQLGVEPEPPAGTNVVVDSSLAFTNGLVCVSWDSVAGAQYRIEGTTNLLELGSGDPLELIKGSITGTGARLTECFDPATLPPPPFRFVRVVRVGAAPEPPPPPSGTFANPVITVGTNEVCLTWASTAGTTYYVQGINDITATNWQNVSSAITATGAGTTYCVSLPSPFSFFRVAVGSAGGPATTNEVRLLAPTLEAGRITLNWSATVGQTYTVEFATSLLPPNWTPLTNLTATANPMSFRDPEPPAGSARFYRVRQP